MLSELLEEGAIAGEFHIADIRVAALAIGGMVSWAYTWYQPDGRLSIDDVGPSLPTSRSRWSEPGRRRERPGPLARCVMALIGGWE